MVSACALYLDKFELTMQKRYVPDEMSALFQESDRVETADPDGGEPDVEYRARRESILKRLDVMGCRALFQETDERPRSICTVNRNGQAPQLRRGEKSNHVHFNALL
jgi:hypothetical protein